MRNERGIELGTFHPSRLTVCIKMPSGAESRPHHLNDDEKALELIAIFAKQMRVWLEFEADIILREDGQETSRVQIKT